MNIAWKKKRNHYEYCVRVKCTPLLDGVCINVPFGTLLPTLQIVHFLKLDY